MIETSGLQRVPARLTHPTWCAPDACTTDEQGNGSHLSGTQWLRASPPNPQSVAVTLVQAAESTDHQPAPVFVDLAFFDEDGELVSVAVEQRLAQALARTLLGGQG